METAGNSSRNYASLTLYFIYCEIAQEGQLPLHNVFQNWNRPSKRVLAIQVGCTGGSL